MSDCIYSATFTTKGNVMNLSPNKNKEYSQDHLDESAVAPDPFQQFKTWFDDAHSADLIHPNAAVLATATPDGWPSARVILLKDYDEKGFVWYTNMASRKGEELTQNPHAALVFWWAQLERQVRIEGVVEQVIGKEADAYFKTRPRNSQLGAWVSNQSEVISGRPVLEQNFQEMTEKFQNQEISRPPFWGGYRLVPQVVEFWKGRPSRLHDRLRYRYSGDGAWNLERLAP